MKVSEFNKDDYSKYDKAAKERLCSFLQARGHKIIDKEENYSIDITSELNGKTHYFEVEFKVKYPFTCQNDFKFESVSFLVMVKTLLENPEMLLDGKKPELGVLGL